MLNRVKKSLSIRLGFLSLEDLNVEACIKKGLKLGKNCHGLFGITIGYAHRWLIEIVKSVMLNKAIRKGN